jgi:hypothetical protein
VVDMTLRSSADSLLTAAGTGPGPGNGGRGNGGTGNGDTGNGGSGNGSGGAAK